MAESGSLLCGVQIPPGSRTRGPGATRRSTIGTAALGRSIQRANMLRRRLHEFRNLVSTAPVCPMPGLAGESTWRFGRLPGPQ